MCVARLYDNDYGNKFEAIEAGPEEGFSDTNSFPCTLEVIDATSYAQPQHPAIPRTVF